MNKIVMNIFVLIAVVVLTFATQKNNLYANVFAAQLKISNPDGSDFDGNFSDGTGAMLSFFLNDTASVVTVEVVDLSSGNVISTIDGGAMSRGLNSVQWDGSGADAAGQYLYRVTAEQPNASATDWTLFWDSGDIDIFTRGVVVITDQTDPNFGLIFTSNDGGALGTGINIYNPDGSFHDPFLVAADLSSGGDVDYAGNAPLFAVLDSVGRIYVSNGDLGQVMRINRDFTTDVVISGLSFPKGLYVEGAGEDFTIYVAADNQILRGNLGTASFMTASGMETVAAFTDFFPHQVILDDAGSLYVTLRQANDLGSDGRGIRKFDISGTLPVTDNDAFWFLMESKTFIANDMLIDRGDDPTSADDDILYYCTRAGGGNDQDGIWRVDDINSIFPDTVRIITEQTFYGGDENVQARATLDFDAAGNIIFMENANEHIFFVAPPGEGVTNSFTTVSPDTITVEVPTSVELADGLTPKSYNLEANYPNPFNPSTTVKYYIAKPGKTSIKIYNLRGEEIKTIVNETQAAGAYSAIWNGVNNSGQTVASGVYIVTLKSGDFIQSRRVTLLK